MKHPHLMMPLVTTLALLAMPVSGAGLDPKRVPADAQWVLHLDMDATRKSAMWALVSAHLRQDPTAQAKIDATCNSLGMQFPDDVHGVTMFGGLKAPSAVILLDAGLNVDKVQAMLLANPGYKRTTYGTHDVISWLDKDTGKTNFGTIFSPTLAVIADSSEQVQQTLDVLDGKIKSLQATDALMAGQGTTVLLYLAGMGLNDLPGGQKPESPVLSQVKTAWLTVSQEDGKVVIRAALSATSVDTAEKIMQIVEGFKANAILAGTSSQVDVKLKWASVVMQNLKVNVSGQIVGMEMPMPMDAVGAFLDTMAPHPPATPGNAPKAVNTKP